MRASIAPAPALPDGDPVDVWGRDPARVGAAEQFLMDAHGHGARGVEGLQAHAVRWGLWDPETVHLAVSIERERDLVRQRAECSTCGHPAHFHTTFCMTDDDCQCGEFVPLPEEPDCA